jgi:hypothetical protein
MKTTFKIIASINAGLFLSWATVRIVLGISFTQDCGGYLERAASANTVELAKPALAAAVLYIEVKELTAGYTSILWRTPDEDVGFWYQNLKASLEELKAVKPDASPLEKSNMLMKLRETLQTDGSEGSLVRVPSGISIFPHNAKAAFCGSISFLAFLVSSLVAACASSKPTSYYTQRRR